MKAENENDQREAGDPEDGQRIPSPTEIRWAMAVHAHDPETFGDLFVLLAWVEVIR